MAFCLEQKWICIDVPIRLVCRWCLESFIHPLTGMLSRLNSPVHIPGTYHTSARVPLGCGWTLGVVMHPSRYCENMHTIRNVLVFEDLFFFFLNYFCLLLFMYLGFWRALFQNQFYFSYPRLASRNDNIAWSNSGMHVDKPTVGI